MKVLLEERVKKESLINMPTGITSLLIKEAAKCENYASDLFIDYASLYEMMKAWDLSALRSHYLFGFRPLGVDSEQMILAAMREYRAIYCLSLRLLSEGDEIVLTLAKLGSRDKPAASTALLGALSE